MEYKYTAVYEISGIEQKSPSDIELLAEGAVRALLTRNVDELAGRANEELAIWDALINGLMPQGRNSLFADSIKNARMRLCPKFEEKPHILIEMAGECEELNDKKVLMETDGFVAYLIASDPSELIRSQGESVIAAVLTSLLFETGGAITPDKVWDSIAIVRSDGKRVIPVSGSMTMEIGEADPLADDAPTRIAESYRRLSSGDKGFERIVKLLTLSLEAERDKLRSFLFGWTALETFVTKVFEQYESQMLATLKEGSQPSLRASYVNRIQTVMKRNYHLADKFNLVAISLCTVGAESDVEVFRTANKARNTLVHGSNIDEAGLPVKSVRDLLVKYLHLHLGGTPRPATAKMTMRIAGRHNPFA